MSLTKHDRPARSWWTIGYREARAHAHIVAVILWTGMAMWSNQVAERVSVSLSARYQTQSGTASYNEAALLATLNMTF